MDKNTAGHEFEEISALIRDEEEAALAAFRSGDFPGAVMKKWRESRQDEAPRPKIRRAAVWASAAALLIVAVSAILLVRRAPAPEERPGLQIIASVLGGLPGGASLGREEPAGPGDGVPVGATGLAESVLSALAAAEGTGRRHGELAHPDAGAAPAPRLSLDRKMEILFRDRVIERVFLLLKDPSKEV